MDIASKNFVVLGRSGVLGQEMTRQLKERGAHVLGTANSQASDEPSCDVVQLDLASSSSIMTAANTVAERFSTLDGVINCAGRVGFATIAETSASDAATLMQINHLGPAHFITLVLPALLKAGEVNGEAIVVGITGVVAERSFPGLAAYGESKLAASRHLAALTQELRRFKIKTLDARPGHTETGLATRPLFGIAPNFPEGMSAEHVVAKIIEGIETGKSEIPSTDF